ncbi:MAG TPA: trypsin-like peptidase domain-containing protein [Blastocatellia bacterium]|nr:trypsin-like peptidase domain-containing protein [Blastocatellia bacterium]
MGNGIVIRLAGVRQPTTRIFHQEVISVGTASDCDVVIEAEGFSLPQEAVILTLRRREEGYRITTVDAMAGVTRDGESVAVGDALSDGDTFYFGETGIRLRAFALTDSGDITESLRLGVTVLANARPSRLTTSVMAGESDEAEISKGRRSMPRTDIALVFVKKLLRELVAEIPRGALYAIAGILSVIAFVIITIISVNTLGFLEGRRNNRAIDELKQKVNDVSGEIDKLSASLQEARTETSNIRSSLSLPEKIVNSYGEGVCLIYGTYVFVDPRVGGGGEVKFKEPSGNENPIGPDGAVNLGVDGNGRVYEVEFMGTGFLAAKGFVLTNRHVIQAWDEDDIASLIMNRGFRPRLKELLAYFPQTSQPFKLTPVKTSSDQDVALCTFDQGGAELLPLPLDESSDGAGAGVARGQAVVLLGYPAGLEGLIARTNNISKANRRLYGNLSYRTQLNELAASSKIIPQSTQGHISDVSPQLVYDARTDEGGSGGPVFGANGKVIGINQAILMSSQSTASFGVPIRHGLALLKKHQLSLSAKK